MDNISSNAMNKLKLGAILLIVLLLIGTVNRFFNGEKIDKANAERDSLAKAGVNKVDLNKSIIALITKEPKVKEAIITESNILYISVEDDGTKRDGLAEYYCNLLKQNNLSIQIKIVKYRSTNDPNKDNAYGVLLGKSECK